eukprot:6507982-Prymnesium_polylepis.1
MADSVVSGYFRMVTGRACRPGRRSGPSTWGCGADALEQLGEEGLWASIGGAWRHPARQAGCHGVTRGRVRVSTRSDQQQ